MGAGASVDADGVAGTEDALKLAEETSAHVGETAEAASGAVAGAAAGAADAHHDQLISSCGARRFEILDERCLMSPGSE